MNRCIAVLTLAGGCGGPLPVQVFDRNRDDPFSHEDIPEEMRDAIGGASELLGVQFALWPDNEGWKVRAVLESGHKMRGRLLWLNVTACVFESAIDPNVFAHEVGHCAGLGHVDNPRNLMCDCNTPGDYLTTGQDDAIDALVRRWGR